MATRSLLLESAIPRKRLIIGVLRKHAGPLRSLHTARLTIAGHPARLRRGSQWQQASRIRGGQTRAIFTDALPTVLVPPAVFFGLLITLWTYKCVMTVIFQDKIIYMPYMPPFARSEKIEDYVGSCRPVRWTTTSIRSEDSVKLSLCIGSLAPQKPPRTVLCYFHGNGASLPPRLPMLSQVLKTISPELDVTLVALSYRGYWTSSGRATGSGIRKDARATIDWIKQTYPGANLVLWGQSIGAGVACAAAVDRPPAALILETPFTSIKNMLIALYPQKWLPYQYLWPFLWNHWDSLTALKQIGTKPPVLLLVAGRDEVVPPAEADMIEEALHTGGFVAKRVDILGSLHTEATTRREGQQAIAAFLTGSHDRHCTHHEL